MNAVLDRQMEQFQHRVQQKINLADDEIQRLSNHFALIRADILDTQDQLNRTKVQASQFKQVLTGREKSQQARTDAVIARIRTDHHAMMQELQEKQNQEILTIQHTFDEALTSLEETSLQKMAQKTSPIDQVMAATQSEYSRIRDTSGKAGTGLEIDETRDIEAVQQLGFSRADRLEAMIQSRNQERLESLLQGKARLSDCVSTLEEMERNHSSRMAAFKTRLDTLDAAHAQKLKRENDRHHRTTDGLNRRQLEFETRAKSIEKTLRRIEKHHKVQVDTAVHEAEILQTDVVAAEAKSQAIADQNAKLQSWKGKIAQLKKQLETRVRELGQTRSDNETMKREIARLQHEAGLTKRRSTRTLNKM
jgi:hypothetical protein